MPSLFAIPDFYDEIKAAEIRKALKGTLFTVEIVLNQKKTLIGRSASFQDPIYLPPSLVKQFDLKPGKSIECYIALQQASGGTAWRYTLQEAGLALQKCTEPKPSNLTIPKQKSFPRLSDKEPAIAINLTEKQVNSLKNASKMIQNISFILPPSTTLSLYIDEATLSSQVGVIAGVAWQGGAAVPRKLPYVENHLLQSGGYSCPDKINQAVDALFNLSQCPLAFPFVIALAVPERMGSASQNYIYQVAQSIRLLFRWIFPTQDNTDIPVNIFLERYCQYEENMTISQSLTTFYKSLEKSSTPFRINRVDFVSKDFDYIPHADLLAYLVQENNPISRQIVDAFNLKQLPGYLQLSSQCLFDLDEIEVLTERSIDAVLRILEGTTNTFLDETILQYLKKKFAQSHELRTLLLATLEDRFREKTPNLSLMRKLTNKVFSIVGDPDENTPGRTRLIHTLISLQNANHHGRPEEVNHLRESYTTLKERLLEANRELIAYTDLNMAVSYADTFDFEAAFQITETLITDPLFEALTPHMKGRAWSAQGQYYCFSNMSEEADGCFEKALVEFAKTGLSKNVKEKETTQSSIYGLINALNSHLPSWRRWSARILNLTTTHVVALASSASLEEQYIHHGLLRIFWYQAEQQDVQELKEKYLSTRSHWKSHNQHPWELICLYRGIFLAQKGFGSSSQWFNRALEICKASQHGSIMELIGAMIATVAFCAEGKEEYKEEAESLLSKVLPKLPKAKSSISTLTSILQNPSENAIPKALAALPFNYH